LDGDWMVIESYWLVVGCLFIVGWFTGVKPFCMKANINKKGLTALAISPF